MTSRRPVHNLWRAMRAQRGELSGAILLGYLASASAVALLATAGWLIATAAGAPPVLTLTVAAVMVRAFALGRAVFRYFERLAGHDAAFRGLVGLRVSVFTQLERLAPAGLAHFGRGDLLTRLIGDVDAAVDLPLRVVLPWSQSILVLLGTVGFLWWLLPGLAAVMVFSGILGLAIVPLLIARVTARAEGQVAPQRAELASSLVTAFSAVADLNAFGATPGAIAQLSKIDEQLTSLSRKSAAGLALGGALITLIQGITVIGMIWVITPAITSGQVSPVWIAVAALLPLAVFDVLANLPGAAAAVPRVRGSADRIEELNDLPSPVIAPLHPKGMQPGFQGIKIRDLSVYWNQGNVPALSDVSFDLEPGEHLYVVGPSGSGKSTLANVLMGFIAYTGSVRINGSELRDVDPSVLRERVGLLAQRAHVFNTSIEENITLGRVDLSRESVQEAVSGAQLDRFVSRLPQGLQSSVGAFGSSISGGEGQRLALARITVEPRDFVILDEPTEHLDAQTVRAVELTLASEFARSSTLTITHHLLAIPDDARVIELIDGVVTSQGTCGELRAGAGWFAGQWRAQHEVALVSSGKFSINEHASNDSGHDG